MKTLKVSQQTQNELRTPFVWNRPRSKLYDYHDEIGGLYYQPMMKYILSRESGGSREMVNVPDRIQSNFDRIVYKRRHEPEDLQEFLSHSYARRLKDVNSKTVHVKNELMRWSKDPNSLNMVRGSANIRDRYLCQLQLVYTAQQAAEARQRAERGGSVEQEPWEEFLELTQEKQECSRYEPGYEKVVLDQRHHRQTKSHSQENETKKQEFAAKNEIQQSTIVETSKQYEEKRVTERRQTQNMELSSSSMVEQGGVKQVEQMFGKSSVEIAAAANKESIKKEAGPVERAMKKADRFSGGKLPRKQFILIPIP